MGAMTSGGTIRTSQLVRTPADHSVSASVRAARFAGGGVECANCGREAAVVQRQTELMSREQRRKEREQDARGSCLSRGPLAA